MEKIKALIIEDEMPAVELIQSYLQDYPNIEVAAVCNDGFSGIKAVQEHKPQLIFLDVQMPKLTGFEMLELIDELPAIIFTTAFDEYAIKAFEMNAVDYLLKPFSRERFASAVKKAIDKMQLFDSKSSQNVKIETNSFHPEGRLIERIVIKKESKILVIPDNKISHLEAYGDYVFVYSGEERHIKQKTMKFYEQNLDSKKFLRIHRSWIVNVDYIDQIMLYEKDTYKVKLKTGHELRASRAGYKNLREFF